MTTTSTTIVTQLINEGRQQHGAIDAIAVPQALFDDLLEEVMAAGGDVGFASCQVDGVTVTAGGTPEGTPLVRPSGSSEDVPLLRAEA